MVFKKNIIAPTRDRKNLSIYRD